MELYDSMMAGHEAERCAPAAQAPVLLDMLSWRAAAVHSTPSLTTPLSTGCAGCECNCHLLGTAGRPCRPSWPTSYLTAVSSCRWC